LNQWMYYDYIREALQKNRKIIIDPICGIPELWMNFYEIPVFLREDKNN